MLDAICLYFIDKLKNNPKTKGWVITPLVVHPDCVCYHNGGIAVKPIPHNASPVDFFIKNVASSNNAVIKVKIPGRPLRLINLNFTVPYGATKTAGSIVYLSCWRANGYAQRDVVILRKWGRVRAEQYTHDGYDSLMVHRIYRVTKNSTKKRTVIHNDYFDCTSSDSADKAAEIIAQLITQSLKEGGKRERFRRRDHCYMIDINNSYQYKMDENFIHMLETI